MPDLIYEKNPEGHYAIFTLNRPERLNALGGELNKQLGEALKDFNNGFVHTINFLPQDYAFINLIKMRNYSHLKLKKQILETAKLQEFDLIIDSQTRINNSLLIKSIPHKYFVSPSAKFLLSNPRKMILNSKNVCGRLFEYFKKNLNKNISIPTEINNLEKKYLDEASKLFKNDKKYIGFSITAGHPTRQKEISLNTIIEVANYFSQKNFIPTFLIEEK